jgi:glycosyltransferase involved in cell wall biosynthesis
MKPLVIVATLLGGEGPTGVETHFRQVAAVACTHGVETIIVTPYTGSRSLRAIYRPLKNLNTEWGRAAYRRCQAWALRRQLHILFRGHSDRAITFYAQCPLSARAALAARGARSARVLMVVHYNLSEGDEVVARGLARVGGGTWRRLRQLERETLPRLDGIAFVSDFMRRMVNARVTSIREVPQETIVNFPSALQPGEVEARPERDLIAIGTLEPRKNQAFLLRVLSAAKRAGRRYTLTVVGDGPDRAKLERLARMLDLTEQVRFLGFQPGACRLISAHRALVHAASVENCPIIIAEAFSRGRPVLAAPVGGIPELYDAGAEGDHWDLENPDEGAARLIALLDDPARYAAMAAAALSRFERVFAAAPERWLHFLLASATPPANGTRDAGPSPAALARGAA